jgi:tetratricopeptide (TPR) repeat protein
MAGSATPPSSSSGWDALRAADWDAARAALEADLAHQETAAALDRLARAKDLLGGQPDSIEWGWVALVESERAVDPTPALEHAERALAVARSARDSDLELAALGRAGLAEIALGRIEERMTRFDEGMTASAAGEAADLRTLGDLYCAANLAAAITLDVGRFGQWTEVVMRFMERTGHPDLLSFCGTCCAEVCRAAGQ